LKQISTAIALKRLEPGVVLKTRVDKKKKNAKFIDAIRLAEIHNLKYLIRW
jgi:hypothetical protein